MKLPPRHRNLIFVSAGATSWVFRVRDSHLILKIARQQAIKDFERENAFYDELEKHEPSPYVLQSIFRCHLLNFLPVMKGSLEQRIRVNRGRPQSPGDNEATSEVLQRRWAMEMAGAVAWLESLDYAHGDLRPPNILLTETDHVKLADFDSVSKIGSPCRGSAPPWARVRGMEAGAEKRGTFGEHGPRTELFALGSIIYTITRGSEPYESYQNDTRVVQWLQNMEFPSLGETELDQIIDKCWKGSYLLVKDLYEETTRLAGAVSAPESTALNREQLSALREQCTRQLDDLGAVLENYSCELLPQN